MSAPKMEAVIASFPATFGLRAWSGVFRISPERSYVNDSGELQLYTQKLFEGRWTDFAKGTEEELRKEVIAPARTRPRERPKGTKMGRGHFKLIADVLREIQPRHPVSAAQWKATVELFADRLDATNGRFDRERFLRACGVES